MKLLWKQCTVKRLACEKFKLKWQLGTVHYTVIMCTGGVSYLMGNSLAAYLTMCNVPECVKCDKIEMSYSPWYSLVP